MARSSRARSTSRPHSTDTPTATTLEPKQTFAQLLEGAVTHPGVISTAYRQFHGYSIGNQLLALAQCSSRGIEPGPDRHVPAWKALGRQVTKGQTAPTLCMPVTFKRAQKADSTWRTRTSSRGFIYRPRWFALSQTTGADLPAAPIPTWDREQALTALNVTEVPFDLMDGNVMGFARGRSIAISTLNPLPYKTRFHELAHVRCSIRWSTNSKTASESKRA